MAGQALSPTKSYAIICFVCLMIHYLGEMAETCKEKLAIFSHFTLYLAMSANKKIGVEMYMCFSD